MGDVRGLCGNHGVRGGLQGFPEEILPACGEAGSYPRRTNHEGRAITPPLRGAIQHGTLPRHEKAANDQLGSDDGRDVPGAVGEEAAVPVEVYRGRGRGRRAVLRHALDLLHLGESIDGESTGN